MKTFQFGALLLSAIAFAEVKQAAPESFIVEHKIELAGAPAKTYRALTDVGHWWHSDHTWSGSALNLSLKPEAGGCFCEKWKDGSVEHGRVVYAHADKMLRLSSSLGPLQDMAVTGVLTFALEAKGPATTLTLTYRVSGDKTHALDKLAPVVDKVLATQLARLKTFAATGKPD
jgi:uncharacterized protein YndB with AHSA1/START domain